MVPSVPSDKRCDDLGVSQDVGSLLPVLISRNYNPILGQRKL